MEPLISEQSFQKLTGQFAALQPILVVGDLGIDKYTHGDVKRISPEAPVPVLEVTKEWNKLGLAANVSDNLNSLDVTSTLCGLVGDDSRGSLLESLLEERGLKTWGIVRDSYRMTTFKERVTTATQQICRVDYETKTAISDNIYKRFITRVAEFSANHSAVIIEDYGKGLITQELASYVIKSFQDAGKLVAVDPSRTTPPTWYKGASLLKPNLTEAHLMAEALGYFKERDLTKIAQILVEKLQLEKLIITLGADGMCLLDLKSDGKLHFIPTAANEVFDVSGAGDTAIAAITASLVAGGSLADAAWIGNCAAGVVVRKRGTALCDQQELAGFYQALRKSFS